MDWAKARQGYELFSPPAKAGGNSTLVQLIRIQLNRNADSIPNENQLNRNGASAHSFIPFLCNR
jgi:hypothetical protein